MEETQSLADKCQVIADTLKCQQIGDSLRKIT